MSFFEAVKSQLTKVQADPTNCLFHSFFFLIRRADRVVVGSTDFKNVPSQKCEVEIGYGLGKEFEHSGYMTEAVKVMCEFAAVQDNISHVIAGTDVDGFASQRILDRCGFKKYEQEDTF